VIFRYLINCYVLPAENAVVKNPIAALKKKHSGFYTSVFWPLVAGQDPLPRQKNHSSMGQTRLFLKRRNRLRNRYTVTTNHLLLQCHLGKTVGLLPISQPNRDFLGNNCNEKAPPGGCPTHGSGNCLNRSPHTEILSQMANIEKGRAAPRPSS
jgi:hypothetical protein